MKLSPNFDLAEFVRSDTADKLKLSNAPTAEHLANLVRTAAGMEQVRILLAGKPIKVTSGYRSPAMNAAVKGTATSAHPMGFACDFTVPGMTPVQIMKLLDQKLTYDQLILEADRGIVHISFDPKARQQTRTQKGGPGTELLVGIQP